MKDAEYRRILFAVDAEVRAQAAAPMVARLALGTGAEVTVLHVQRVDFIPRFGTVVEPDAECRQLVTGIASELEAAGVPAGFEVRAAHRERIAEEIATAAREHKADLVALGSRGLSDLAGFVLGSVSHKVVRLLDCPVLVVPEHAHPDKAPIRKILVGVAGGYGDAEALAAAVALARATGAEILVLHVDFVYAGEAAAYSETEAAGRALVDGFVSKLGGSGVKATGWSFMEGNSVASDIAQAARTWQADLIVIGSRRHSDLAAMFAGSVDHEVVQTSDQPVLIASRPPKKG